MSAAASLHPVSGSPREVEELVAGWLDEKSPPPLSVRTSGTTGEPKDVLLSAAAMRASAKSALKRLGGPGQWLLAVPAHHVAGLQVLVRSRLAASSPVILGEHADLPTAARALTRGPRYVSLVPTQLHRYLQDPAATQALSGFDAVLLGGAAASPGLLRRARDHAVRVVTTYGMSETCGGCVYDGQPLDAVRVAINDDGLIRLAGPVLFDGYSGQPDLTAEALRDGWLHTSDLGRFSASRRLEVLGRADDTIVSGGVNVNLTAVEHRVIAMPGVAQCAAVGVPDPEWGSRVVAVVVAMSEAQPPDLTSIRDWVAAELPRTWAPREVAVLDQLPLLTSGKADRVTVTQMLSGSLPGTGRRS